MYIQHNLPALNSERNLKINKNKLSKSLEKLSSGYRINRAGDDAAGLAITEGMRAAIRGLSQAESNVQDGMNLIRTAEGAMQEIHAMLNRAYELSITAANSTYNHANRQIIQGEIDALVDEIQRIADNTEFNGINILSRSGGGIDVEYSGTLPAWVGTGASMNNGFLSELYETTETFTDSTGTSANYTIEHEAAVLDFSAFTGTAAQKADLKEGGFYSTCYTCYNHYSIRFVDGTSNSLDRSGNHFVYNIGIDNISTAEDLVSAIIAGTDGGNPNSHFTKLTVDPTDAKKLVVYDDRSKNPSPVTGSGSWNSWDNPQFDINSTSCSGFGLFGKGIATKKKEVGDIQLQIGPGAAETMQVDLPDVTPGQLGIGNISVRTQENAFKSMSSVKRAIDFLSGERGRMGAYENRLEHTYAVLTNNNENLSAAESRIRDANIAKEVTELTKMNILLQGAQSMLVHANASPEFILRMLQ